MAVSYRLELNMQQLSILVARTHFPLSQPQNVQRLGEAVRKYGAMVQARAVYNVSGYPVTFDGNVFRVRVVTGALKGSIELQWPYGSMFTARVYVNGTHTALAAAAPGFSQKPQPVSKYAAAIEQGHPAIDLKKTMRGKIVPFFGARASKPRGPYVAGGITPLSDDRSVGSKWQSEALNAKLAAQGKAPMIFTKKGGKAVFKGSATGSSYFIAFRRVGNTGWIIPAAKPRPFMRAAVEGTRERGRLLMVNAAVEMLDPRK